MARLIHNKKTILPEMAYESSMIKTAMGLMFASKKRVEKGICLLAPSISTPLLSSITNLFVFFPLEILFINSNSKVVDKCLLKPFQLIYTPKKPCKYIIEASRGKFNNIKLGDKVEVKH